jgi:hypothetical protein
MVATEDYGHLVPTKESLQRWGSTHLAELDSPLKTATKTMELNQFGPDQTGSVIDLGALPELEKSLAEFGRQILALPDLDLKAFREVVRDTQAFAEDVPDRSQAPLVDIGDLAQRVTNSPHFQWHQPDLVNRAQDLATSLRNAVPEEFHRGDVRTASGMTVMLPLDPGYRQHRTYCGSLSFWQDTGWQAVVDRVSGACPL